MSCSAPQTPAEGDRRFKEIGTPCEWIEKYRPGGHHPVHLGDVFKNGRYKVIRKLGYGAFSTVWLIVDQRYGGFTALKILTAESSKESKELEIHQHLAKSTNKYGEKYVTALLDHFLHEGPNGVHLCLQFEVMGPNANFMVQNLPTLKGSSWETTELRYPYWMAKRMLRQTLQGLTFLHANGITHGDLQPGNMMFVLQDMSAVPENELAQDDAYPDDPEWEISISNPIERLDGKVDKWAPRYLAIPQHLEKYTNIGHDLCIKLSDLGGSFFSSKLPKKQITPTSLRAPENILGRVNDKNVDIWSFGCLMFEFLTGRPLFLVPGWYGIEEEEDIHLLQINGRIGPLPDHIFTQWTRSSTYFDTNGVQFNELLVDLPEDHVAPHPTKLEPLEQYFDTCKPPEMGESEAEAAKTLLRSILRYDYVERPTAEKLLQDPWFTS